jgi:hypothetical protein
MDELLIDMEGQVEHRRGKIPELLTHNSTSSD